MACFSWMRLGRVAWEFSKEETDVANVFESSAAEAHLRGAYICIDFGPDRAGETD